MITNRVQIETQYPKVRFTVSNEALKNFTLETKHEQLTALIFQPPVISFLINFQLNNLSHFFFRDILQSFHEPCKVVVEF